MKKAIVISAFPACGKSHFFNNHKEKFAIHECHNGREIDTVEYDEKKDLVVLDSDSSNFSWIKDMDGNNTTDRNPDFPANYIQHIIENRDKADIIFVSSHKQVRDAMNKAVIKYYSVYPYSDCKQAWLDRMKNRGNDDKFLKFIDINWDTFMDEIGDNYGKSLILIDQDQCIIDIIGNIMKAEGILKESDLFIQYP